MEAVRLKGLQLAIKYSQAPGYSGCSACVGTSETSPMHDVETTCRETRANPIPVLPPGGHPKTELTSSECSFQGRRRRGTRSSSWTTAWRRAAGRQLRRQLARIGKLKQVIWRVHTPSQRLLSNLLREHGDCVREMQPRSTMQTANR